MAQQGALFEISLIVRTIIFVLICGIVTILNIPLTIYRQILRVVAKIWRPDLAKIVPSYHQLVAHDDFFEDKVAFNIVTWHVLEGCLSVEGLRKIFMENVINSRKPNGELEFPEFKQYFVNFGGYLFWKNAHNFEIKNHIRSIELDSEAKEWTEKDLQRMISRLTSARWTKNRGFWEIIVVNNYTSARSSGDSVMIFRFHHSLADGYSYLNCIVRRLCRAENMLAAIPSFPKRSKLQIFMHALAAPFRLPYDFVRLLAELNDDKNRWKVEREQLRKQFTTVWSQPVEVQVFKKLKRKFGVSFQAVLSTVIGAAIRRLMEKEGQDVPEILTVLIPFPKKDHPEGLKNHTDFSYVKLPIKESDPEKRLRLAQSFLQKEVTSTARFLLYKIFGFLGGLPFALVKKIPDNSHTVTLSCFPGIHGDIYLGEHKGYEGNFTMGTARGCAGATVTTLSCFGVLRFAITIDKGIYPSEDIAAAFNSFIEEEIQGLVDAEAPLSGFKDVTPLLP